MARKTIDSVRADKLAQLDAIRKEVLELDAKVGARIGKLAVKAGLADLGLEDDILTAEFAAIAGRFQAKQKKPNQPAARPDDPA
ncbi:MAG: TraC family protein [Janthinobacterium lividum]